MVRVCRVCAGSLRACIKRISYQTTVLLSCLFYISDIKANDALMTCTETHFVNSGVVRALPVLDFFQQFHVDVEQDSTHVMPTEPKRCLVSQRDLKKIKPRVLVDVRSKEVFEKGALPGSINVPEHHLSTRNFLKNKAVVLVGDSYRYPELYTYCEKLKQHGFRTVYVLEGGYVSSKPNDIQRIDARQFFDAKRKHLWLTVAFSDQKLSSNSNLIVIGSSENREQALKKISERFSVLNNLHKVQSNILLLNDLSLSESETRSYIKADLHAYVYKFDGGVDAYNTFAKMNTAMINQKRQSDAFQHYGCAG